MPETATENESHLVFERHGLGTAPFTVFDCLRFPSDDYLRRDPEAAGRMAGTADRMARLAKVDATRCGCCGRDRDRVAERRLFLIASREKRLAAVCLDCIRATGSSVMLRKVAWIDHEHQRIVNAITNPGGRRRRR